MERLRDKERDRITERKERDLEIEGENAVLF